MPKSKAHAATIHHFATSRVEKASNELDHTRQQMKELKVRQDELSARILRLVKQEGEPDEKGKIRYETEAHKFQVIPGTNIYTDRDKMRTALMVAGLTPKQVTKIEAACVKETPYEYVGVYKKKEAGVEVMSDTDQVAAVAGAGGRGRAS